MAFIGRFSTRVSSVATGSQSDSPCRACWNRAIGAGDPRRRAGRRAALQEQRSSTFLSPRLALATASSPSISATSRPPVLSQEEAQTGCAHRRSAPKPRPSCRRARAAGSGVGDALAERARPTPANSSMPPTAPAELRRPVLPARLLAALWRGERKTDAGNTGQGIRAAVARPWGRVTACPRRPRAFLWRAERRGNAPRRLTWPVPRRVARQHAPDGENPTLGT